MRDYLYNIQYRVHLYDTIYVYIYYNTCVLYYTLTTQTRRRCDATCTSDVFHLGKQDVYT